ncbi:BTAD domain-containing putative transcriptional regulator [Streptomyces paludis]|nr:BTAD domain-containing putative transcriptional regulator [Streptomyces paludis]
MWWSVLGAVEVRVGDQPVALGGAKQRRVLAVLLAEAGGPVPVSRLVDSVWGERPPPTAVGTLRSYVANLRRRLEPDRPPREAGKVLVSTETGYCLRVPEERYDAMSFGKLAESGRASLAGGRPLDALSDLDQALALWRGPAFGEFSSEPFAALESTRLEELRLTSQERHAGAQLAAGLAEPAVAGLRTLVASEPLREQRWEMLALALYRCGRRAESLAVLQQARGALDENLGVGPGRRLRRLERDIVHQDAGLDLEARRVVRAAGPGPGPGSGPVPGSSAAARPAAGTVTRADVPEPDSRDGLDGRDDVLAGVDRALSGTSGGRGGLMLVTGEPGIGKTRIAQAALERAAGRGLAAVVGRCPEGQGVPALWPWLMVLRAVIGGGGRRLRRLADQLGANALITGGDSDRPAPGRARSLGMGKGPAGEGRHGDGGGASSRGPTVIVELLACAARERPLLVVLDDLHWADPDSVRVLRVLTTMLPELPLLLLVTSRDGPELDGAASALVAGLTGTWANRWPLRRLTEAEVVRAVGRRLGPGTGAETGRVIHRRCGGVPFHVNELARLVPTLGTRRLTEALPEGTRNLVRHRLRGLPDGAETTLAVAAVVGERFDFGILAEASDTPRERLLDTLEAGIGWGLIEEDGPTGCYRFSHALVRDTLRRSFSRLRTAGLHARIAEALERRVRAGVRGHAELLDDAAFHWLAATPAGYAEQAVAAATAAAGRAERVHAHQHAARLLTAAIEIIDERAAPADSDGTRRLFDLVVRRGRLASRGAQREEATTVLNRAIALARELNDVQALATAATVHTLESFLAVRDYRTADDTVLTALRDAVRLLPGTDSPLRCLALAALAAELYHDSASEPSKPSAPSGAPGPGTAAVRLSSEAVAMARRLGDEQLLFRVLHLRLQAIRHPDTLGERQALVEEQLALAARPGAGPEWLPMALLRRALTRLEAGDMAAAQTDIVACAAANEQVRLTEVDIHLRWWEALRSGLAGNRAVAERLAGQAYDLHRRLGWGAEPALFAHRITWLLDQDRFADMEELVRAVHRAGSPVPPEHVGLVLALRGRFTEAVAYCPPAHQLPEPPHDWLWLLQMVLRAYTWALCGDGPSCRWALGRLLPYTGRAVTTGSAMLCWGSIDHFLGEVAAVAGERETAIGLLRRAVRHNGELGCPRWRQRSEHRLAALLESADDGGDGQGMG